MEMSSERRMPAWLSALLVLGTAAAVGVLERRRSLRRSVEDHAAHTARNLAIAGIGAAALQLAERPVVDRLALLVHRRRWGLLPRLPLPPAVRTVAGVCLLDYTLYLWHVLVHRVPILWRAHAVHHIDRDLDASTAVRFHFAELLASVPYRAAQIAVLGIPPRTLSIWQTGLLMSILFHHSNLELPPRVERLLSRLVVTPRMHGIHHSRIDAEVNSNWSSGLTVWDWLHGTLQLNVPQQSIAIGVPDYDDEEEVRLTAMLTTLLP
jgi:sterol desaturase/sphingolipid hydroxylase (fatty acid hydroxylase superfamily)